MIDGPVERAPDALHFDLRVRGLSFRQQDIPVKGLITVTVPFGKYAPGEFDALQLKHALVIRLITELDWQDRFRNPGVSGLSAFLDSKGQDAMALVKSPFLIERLHENSSFLRGVYEWRQRLEEKISATFSRDTAGVLNAALVGNRYGLSRQTSDKFREGGTFHVLVISGLHITFIGGVVFALTRRLTRKRELQFLIVTSLLWLYTLAVGANASVARAAFMFSFIAFAPIVARRAASLNALSAAGLLLLVWRPSELVNPSFQLTFLSVFAIVGFAWPLLSRLSAIGTWRPTHDTPHPPIVSPWLRTLSESLYWSEQEWRRESTRSTHTYKLFKTPFADALERWHIQRILRYSFATVVVSSCVQLTLAPLLVIHFHRVSLAAFILNIGVSLLMVALIVFAALSMVFGLVSLGLAAPLAQVTNGINWLMVNSVVPFSRLHLGSLRLPEYSGKAAFVYSLYFVPLVLLAIALARWQPLNSTTVATHKLKLRLLVSSYLFILFLLVTHPFSAARQSWLSVDFLDVGQGDAALVTMPGGVTLLIDGGGRPNFFRRDEAAFERDTRSIGDAVVSEFLWQRGLDRVDYILPTHADADHINGLNDVARNFSVRAALVGRMPEADPAFDLFRTTTGEQSIPLVSVGAGDSLQCGDVSMDVLWPPPGRVNSSSRNNDSVVLLIRYGKHSILMTGDIEMNTETILVRQGDKLRADVVKVAHHGSKTSSIRKFIDATDPGFAVISVGRKSMFGHPHAEVVERWVASGAEVLTTGKCGMITVETDGEELQVKTFVGGCRNNR